MKASRVVLFAALLAITPLLGACSTSCDCPKCGNTVVTPGTNGSTTIVKPNNY